ncbi:MAG: serine/threonine-protein kinase [Halofilum sp. (in: g-proteobacteria)]|nr:serine/threonine-protein kinase [Halofilum sp. (in: g-proteobacteria)]
MTGLFRRNDWTIGLAVVLATGLLTGLGTLRGLEGLAYDAGIWAAGSREPSDRVVVVAVDDASLERLGAWPWSRYTLAEIHALIGRGDPRAVGYTLPLETPQNEHGQRTLRELYQAERDRLDAQGRALFERAIREMGTDRVLAASFRRNGEVVLGARYSAEAEAGSVPALPAALARHALPVDEPAARDWPRLLLGPRAPLVVERVHPPVDQLAAAASAVGLGLRLDADQRQRALHLALRYGEQWLPSLELLLAERSRPTPDGRMAVVPGAGLRVGERLYRTGEDLAVHPLYYRSADGSPFQVVSAAAVHAREVPSGFFRDRVVLVGRTAPSLVEPIATAGGSLEPVLAAAHRVSALLQGDLIAVPAWALWSRLAAFALVALYLMFLLPRLGLATGIAVSVLLVVLAINAELFAIVLEGAWIPLMAPLAALVVGHALLAGKRTVLNTMAGFQAELSDANRRLGEAHRARGELDEAFRRLRRCTPDDATIDSIYSLGLDYERRRRHAQAIEAFRYCRKYRGGYRDVADRIKRNEKLQDSIVLGSRGGGNGTTQTLVLGSGGVEKPMLGRFRIDSELGKGAMGIVYLGHDPKIGRRVAIKTLTLDEEVEAESLDEIKQRFLREAETAGRLDHTHIVAVHDVGEDQDLAWIAMDYLPGEPLSRFASEDKLLPPEEVMEYLAQVAEALQFAHDHKVVHRDVKPDNVIVDRDKQHATVTDFGVAALLDQSRTRSGIVLGTPTFMSPEQLGGKKIDGRSDQFSLGVTLYQLLTGQLPFSGDSLSNLMYRIANERHRDIRQLRDDLPPCASTITNRAMEKDPAKRYASAAQMAQALRRCLGKLE